jgi:hypothetical protein
MSFAISTSATQSAAAMQAANISAPASMRTRFADCADA